MLRWEEKNEGSSAGMQFSRPAYTKLCSRWHHRCQRKRYHSETVKFNTTVEQKHELHEFPIPWKVTDLFLMSKAQRNNVIPANSSQLQMGCLLPNNIGG